jgi:Leucine-rich repeat (LRR) protein
MLRVFPCMYENTKLSILDLSGNQFEEFPDICYPDLVHLAEVKLNGNKLKEVPPAVKELNSLKVLDLGDNGLTSVPGEIADINKLKGKFQHYFRKYTKNSKYQRGYVVYIWLCYNMLHMVYYHLKDLCIMAVIGSLNQCRNL